MNLSEEQYEIIEAYLTNELSAADRVSFENDIQADPKLREEVDRQHDLRLGLRALGIERALERAKVQYKATSASPKSTDRQTTVPPLLAWRYWAVAASIVVMLGIGYYTYQHTNDRQADLAYTETFTPDPTDELVKNFPTGTILPTVRAQLLEALSQYKVGKYDRAINQLRMLPADKQTIDYKNYFLGLSYLANKQPAEAIPLLSRVLVVPSAKLRQKAEWFLALAYVKNEQKEKALPMLKRISVDKANPFQSLATRVLDKIY